MNFNSTSNCIRNGDRRSFHNEGYHSVIPRIILNIGDTIARFVIEKSKSLEKGKNIIGGKTNLRDVFLRKATESMLTLV